jgi:lysozyme
MNLSSRWVWLSLALVGCGPQELTIEDGAIAAAGTPDDEATNVSQAITSRRCPNGPTVNGIDVSIYQHSVNWQAVKNSGIAFGIARISDGVNSLDSTFAGNWAAMKAVGLVRGSYQYFEPGQDPTTQANIVIARVGRLGAGDLPVMLDVESTGGQSPATITARIHTWVNAVTAGTGKTPFIYTGAYFWDASVKTADFAGLGLNVAWYGTNCPGQPNAWANSNWLFHQYTSTASVPGVSGNVDENVFNGTLAQLHAFAGVAAGPPPPPAVPPVAPACGALAAGATLARGATLDSCQGNTRLVHQTDGNLVLYDTHTGAPMWSTQTNGYATNTFAMQGDGNAVLYNGGTPLWSSHTYGHNGAILVVQDDGNLVLYGNGYAPLWSSGTKIAPIPPSCGSLPFGTGLARGQALNSCNGRFTFVHQTDGNVVIYDSGRAIWSTRTNGRATTALVMQGDGNLVLYNGGSALWSSGTPHSAQAFFVMQDDGNAVIYAASGPVWASGTNR